MGSLELKSELNEDILWINSLNKAKLVEFCLYYHYFLLTFESRESI